MHYYKVHLPSRNHFNDEFEEWITTSYSSRHNEHIYENPEREVDTEDLLPMLPTGSFLDDLSVDDNQMIEID